VQRAGLARGEDGADDGDAEQPGHLADALKMPDATPASPAGIDSSTVEVSGTFRPPRCR